MLMCLRPSDEQAFPCGVLTCSLPMRERMPEPGHTEAAESKDKVMLSAGPQCMAWDNICLASCMVLL